MTARILCLTGVAVLLVAGTAVAQTPVRSDLVVNSLGKPPASVESGGSFSLRTAVTNRGSARAGASTVVFVLSTDRRSDRSDVHLEGRRKLGRLNAGARKAFTQSLLVPAGTSAGSYFLLACADGLKRVRERSERNNCRVASRQIAVRDSTPPASPSLTATVQSSPGNDATPNVRGTAEAGSVVTLYKQAACAGPVAGSGTDTSFAGPGLTSTAVLSGLTTTFSATATDAAGNASPCSTTSVTYVLDDDAPAAPTISGTDPASPSNVGAPLVEGTAEPGAAVDVFVDTNCTGSPAATTTADGSGGWSVATPVNQNASNSLRARQSRRRRQRVPVLWAVHLPRGLDPAGRAHDHLDAPGVPQPGGPADRVRRRHARPRRPCVRHCRARGPRLGAGTADGSGDAVIALTTALSEGTSGLRADTADAAGNRSSCSDVFPYVLDTTEPVAPVLQQTVPASPSTDNTPGIRGTATEGVINLYASTTCGGSPVATGTPSELASAAGLSPPAQLNATTVSYTATTTDEAGNASVCSNALSYTERRETTAVSEVEPNQNDVQANAQGITFSEDHLVSGTFAGDADFFKYRTTVAQLVRFELFSGGAEQCTADNTISAMVSGPFAPPADTTDLGIGPCAMWTTVLPPNVDIFPGIAGTNPSSYLLEARRITIAGNESEPNDTPATADPIPAGNDLAMEGTFGNNDFYTFTLEAPASVRIELTSRIGSAQSCEAGTLAGGLVSVRRRWVGPSPQTPTAGSTTAASWTASGRARPTRASQTCPRGRTRSRLRVPRGAGYSLVLTKR